MSGYCRQWVTNYGLIAKLLFEALKGLGKSKAPLECQKAFENVKTRFMIAPALALPEPEKLYDLFVHKQERVALGVLTQTIGPWRSYIL